MNEGTIVAEGLQFPEGPVALPDGSVVFVEIAAGRLSQLLPDGKMRVVATPGGGPNGAAIGPDGSAYVCNNGGFIWHKDPNGGLYPHGRSPDYGGGRIERIDLETGKIERLYDHSDYGPLSGPNDIVFDGQGGFWFTDLGNMGERSIERGRLCYAKSDGSLIRDAGVMMLTPNGIGLSPDEATLYVAETTTARVWAFDIAGPGELKLKTWPTPTPGSMIYAADQWRMFDSLAVEACGNVCVATIAPGGITVLSPSGELVDFISTPDRSTTNICFGGESLQTAWITLSRSGRLLRMPWKRPGLPLNFLNC